MQWSIREAVASDYDDLGILFAEGDTLHREHLPTIFQEPPGGIRDREYVLGLIADERIGLFVAQTKRRLVGLICVMLKESSNIPILVQRCYAVIDNVVVEQTSRRTGVGKALMEKAKQWAVAKGADSIELNVWEFNQGAITFYQTLGYETASRKMRKLL
jgi:ribosomal protein S18 acetylase RimI-like enzyme